MEIRRGKQKGNTKKEREQVTEMCVCALVIENFPISTESQVGYICKYARTYYVNSQVFMFISVHTALFAVAA